MRLIDADKLFKDIVSRFKCCPLIEVGRKSEYVKDIIDEQPTVNQWIPASERLPSKEEYCKNDGRFIVTDGNRVYEDEFDIYADGFIDPKWIRSITCQPIAWQPMPARYKEATNEQ